VTSVAPKFRPDYKGSVEKLPVAVAPQPLPFSHRVHAAAGLKCTGCHTAATTDIRAGLPQPAKCTPCHQDRTQPVNWVRIYKLPDFVFFSHAKHATAGISCAECHGPVQTRDVLAKEKSTSMVACLDCHRAKNAATACNVCHDLGQ
jgi:hypothetical protein